MPPPLKKFFNGPILAGLVTMINGILAVIYGQAGLGDSPSIRGQPALIIGSVFFLCGLILVIWGIFHTLKKTNTPNPRK